jgi:hypothetical protein
VNEHELDKLKELGGLVTLPSGEEAVPVTLQALLPLEGGGSRTERKASLFTFFDQLSKVLPDEDFFIEPESLSLSAQTVNARINFTHFDKVLAELTKKHIRTDIIKLQKLV